MGKKAATPPPAPDPIATANAQGAANVESAIATSLLNQQNVNSPYGSVTYEQTGGQQVGNNFVPQFTRTETLTPEQQQQLDLGNQLGVDLSQVALDQTGRVGGALGQGVDTSNLPGLFGPVSAGPIQTALNPSDFANEGGQLEQATYQRGLNLLNPEFERQSNQLETTLSNRGLPFGSESAEFARDPFERRRNDALENLALSSVGAGRDEQSRLFGQALTEGKFGNSAQQQDFLQGANNASIGNAARAQGFQENAFQRSLPINDIAALLGTAPGVQGPQFTPTPAVGVESPDILGATMGASNIAANNFATQQQARSGLLSGLFGLGGTLGGAAILSDRRLKDAIRRIGKLGQFALYKYIKGGVEEIGVMAQDVLKVIPEAVVEKDGYLAVKYDMVM